MPDEASEQSIDPLDDKTQDKIIDPLPKDLDDVQKRRTISKDNMKTGKIKMLSTIHLIYRSIIWLRASLT